MKTFLTLLIVTVGLAAAALLPIVPQRGEAASDERRVELVAEPVLAPGVPDESRKTNIG